ncbi:MAG TPA: universal stress protein, partial [Gaiellaceae bacterium]
IPLRETTHAPAEILPWHLEYRQIVVPVFAEANVATAMNVACRLAAERRSRITIVAPLEVPLGFPIGARLPEEEFLGDLLDDAEAIADSYGIRALSRLVRTRSASDAIVAEARHHHAEIIILPADRPPSRRKSRRMPLDATTELVLRRAPCRVLLAVKRSEVLEPRYPLDIQRYSEPVHA